MNYYYVDLSCLVIKANNDKEAEEKVNELINSRKLKPEVCNVEIADSNDYDSEEFETWEN